MKIIQKFFLLILLLFAQSSILNTSLQVFAQEPQSSEVSAELNQATSLTEAVIKLYKDGKYKEALPLAKRALEIRERLLTSNDLRIEHSLVYLGDVQMAIEDYGAAKESYERLLEKRVRRVGPDDIELASTLDRLAVLYFRERKDSKAEETAMRALAIRESKLGPNHPDVARTLYGLAEQARLRGSANQALPLYLRSLSIHAELSGAKGADFEKVSEAFSCLVYESRKSELFKELDAIKKRYAPPPTDNTVEAENRVLNGRALSLPKPSYPEAARNRKEKGVVIIKVLIDETGKVIKATDMCQGPAIISAESIKSALKARFTPTKLSGMPVKVTGVIQYNFVAR